MGFQRACLVPWLVLLCALLAGAGSAEDKGKDPAAVKAAGLNQLARYIKWPESAFKSKEDPLRIGVLGADPFGQTLDVLLKGKKHGSHPIQPVRFPSLAELGECQMLFVPEKEEAQLARVLEKCKDRPVLVVCENAALARQGAGVALYFEHSNLRITVNLDALREARIEASSELLKLVRVIGTRKEGENK
jgi:YfiR/HmsC-like